LGYDATNDLAERNALIFFTFFEILEQTPGQKVPSYLPSPVHMDRFPGTLYEIILMKAFAGISDFPRKQV
jgi:hypothetical protein